MEIKWLGHASFKISANQKSIVLDPFKDGSVPGFNPIREIANEVYCSHNHGDHNAIECVECDHCPPFEVKVINTFHDDQMGALRGPNKIHCFMIEGYKVIHFGDLGCSLTKEQIDELKDADMIMIPVGGYYTIDAKQAYEVVQSIHPKTIIPMHYSGNGFGFDVINSVDLFTKYFDDVIYTKTNSVDFNEIKNHQVVVFNY